MKNTLIIFLLFFVSSTAFATNYYVDATTGNDLNHGTSTGAPWRTLSKVNAQTFLPGDSILFRKGESWTGTLMPQGSGTSGNPIVLGAYDTGVRPAINGDGSVNCTGEPGATKYCTILLNNQEYWIIRDLEVTNFDPSEEGGQTIAQWEGDNESNYADMSNPPKYGGSNSKKCAIMVEANNMGAVNQLHFINLEIHGVNGAISQKNNGGIFLRIFNYDSLNQGHLATYFEDLLIDSCHIHDVDRTGLSNISDYDDRTFTENNNWSPSLNFIVRNNNFERTGANALILRVAENPLIENNIFDHCSIKETGNAAFVFNTDGALMQYNEAMHTRLNQGDHDSGGLDSDYKTKNTTIQYNYLHDNDYGMLVTGGPYYSNGFNDNTIVRYNIIENDGIAVDENEDSFSFKVSGNATNTKFHNNVIYIDGNKTYNDIIFLKDWGGWPDASFFVNNIFYNEGDSTTFDLGQSTRNTFSNNLYYGNQYRKKPIDDNEITGDPLLNDVGNGEDGYKISTGSSAFTAGIKVFSLPPLDYYQNEILDGSPVDIGVHQLSGLSDPDTLTAITDAYVWGGSHEDTNYGSSDDLEVKLGSTDEYSRYTYIKFDISENSNYGFQTGELRLYGGSSQYSMDIDVYLTETSWSESTIDWLSKPDIAESVGTFSISTSSDWHSLDISSSILEQIASSSTLALGLTMSDTTTSLATFDSKDKTAGNAPVLYVRPKAATLEAPSNLSAQVMPTGEINLIWEDNSSSEDGFFIERKITNQTAFFILDSLSSNVITYSDTTIQGNTNYTYRVKAYNSSVTSFGSNLIEETTGLEYLTPNEDMYVRGGLYAGFSYGASDKLRISGGVADVSTERAFFQFDLTGYSTVSYAKLYLYGKAVSPITLTANKISDDEWTSSDTWNTQPAVGSEISTATIDSTTQWYQIDLTSQAKSEMDGNRIFSFAIVDLDLQGIDVELSSSEGQNAPYLVIGGSKDLVPTPTEFSGRAVSTSQIDLWWKDNSSSEDGFKIERKNPGKNFYSKVGEVGANVTTFSDTTALPTQVYTYRVRAYENADEIAFGLTLKSDYAKLEISTGSEWLQITEDSYVEGGANADTNFGPDTTMLVSGNSTAPKKSLLKFDLTAYATIDYAKLYFYGSANVSSMMGVFKASTDSWTEGSVTWNNGPDAGSIIDSVEINTVDHWYAVDVASAAIDETNGNGTFSIILEYLNASDTAIFYSSENNQTSLRPYLVVYGDTVSLNSPTNLKIRTVSTNQIDLSWKDNSSNEDGFAIERRMLPDGDYEVIDTLSVGTTYSDTTVIASTSYRYRVGAIYSKAILDYYSNSDEDYTGTHTEIVTADAHVVGGTNAAQKYGTEQLVEVKSSTNESFAKRAYFKFGLSEYSGINYAKLYFYGSADSSIVVSAFRASDESWDESSIDWNNKPQVDSYHGSTAVGTTDEWHSIDISALIAGQSSYGDITIGLTDLDTLVVGVDIHSLQNTSDFSPYLILEADTSTINAPTYLRTSLESNGQILLTWDDQSDNEGGFKIERKALDGPFLEIDCVPAGVESYYDDNNFSSRKFTYRVRAFILFTHSNYSDESIASTNQVSLETLDDAYIRGGSNSSSAYGILDSLELEVKEGTVGDYKRRSYLKYDLSQFAAIDFAILKIYGRADQVMDLHAYDVSGDNWNEESITWNNAPALTEYVGKMSLNTTDQWYTIDLTALAIEQLAGNDTLSIGLKDSLTLNKNIYLYSKENTSGIAPELIVGGSTDPVKDLYLIIGQSNTAGRGEIEDQDTVTLSNVYLLDSLGQWVDAKNPLNVHSNIRKDISVQGLGYGYTFAKLVQEATSRDIGMVVNARGSSSINSWVKGASDNYFNLAYQRLEHAVNMPGVELKGILWHQGESDKSSTSTYLGKLEAFIADLRDTLNMPNLPFVAGQISQDHVENQNFNNMITGLPPQVSNTDYVESAGLETVSDNTHFNSRGQRMLGVRYAAKILEMIYGYQSYQDTILIAEDTYVRDGSSESTSYGSATIIRVKEINSTGYTRRGYMKFDLSNISGHLIDAKLMMTGEVNQEGNASLDISIYGTTDGWDETITWLTKPALDEKVMSFHVEGTTQQSYSVYLSDYAKEEFESDQVVSFGLKDDNVESETFKIVTKEDSNQDLWPYLLVSYVSTSSSGSRQAREVLPSENIVDNPKIKIYPNPASNHLTIEGDEIRNVNLLDMQGRLIESFNDQTAPSTIQLDSVPSGIYLIQIINLNGDSTTLKLIKE